LKSFLEKLEILIISERCTEWIMREANIRTVQGRDIGRNIPPSLRDG